MTFQVDPSGYAGGFPFTFQGHLGLQDTPALKGMVTHDSCIAAKLHSFRCKTLGCNLQPIALIGSNTYTWNICAQNVAHYNNTMYIKWGYITQNIHFPNQSTSNPVWGYRVPPVNLFDHLCSASAKKAPKAAAIQQSKNIRRNHHQSKYKLDIRFLLGRNHPGPFYFVNFQTRSVSARSSSNRLIYVLQGARWTAWNFKAKLTAASCSFSDWSWCNFADFCARSRRFSFKIFKSHPKSLANNGQWLPNLHGTSGDDHPASHNGLVVATVTRWKLSTSTLTCTFGNEKLLLYW